MSLDVRNAFNSLSRELILACLPDDLPGRSLIAALYDTRGLQAVTPGGDAVIPCDRGVIQGCPLAAALFAYTLMAGPVAMALADCAPGERPAPLPPASLPSADLCLAAVPPPAPLLPPLGLAFYADDGYLAVGADATCAADHFLALLSARLAQAGLSVARSTPQKDKTVLMLGADAPDAAGPCAAWGPWVRASCNVVDAVVCLGVPLPGSAVGSRATCRQAVQRKVSAAVSVVMRDIPLLRPAMHALTALRLAGTWTRLEYLASMTDPDLFPLSELARAEAADAAVIHGLLGPHGARMTARCWLRASLPVRDGGLGLRQATREVGPARRRAAAAIAVAEGLPLPPFVPPAILGSPSGLASWDGGSAAARTALGDALVASDAPVDRARSLALQSARGVAGAWMHGHHDMADGTLPDDGVLATALALRLGVPLYSPLRCYGGPPACPTGCHGGLAVVDDAGVHALGCNSTLTPRHNYGRDAILAFFQRECGITGDANILKEAAVGRDGSARRGYGGEPRPGDVAVRLPGTGQWSFLDLMVVSMRPGLLARMDHGGDGGEMHRTAWREKLATSAGGPAVVAAGHRFLPIAASAYGDLDPRSIAGLTALAGQVARARNLGDRASRMCGPSLAWRLRRVVVASVVFGGARAVNGILEAAGVAPAEWSFPPACVSVTEALVREAGGLAAAACA